MKTMKKLPKLPEWATECATRKTGKFKMHSNRKFALSAMLSHDDIDLYHYVDGEWELVFERRKENYLFNKKNCEVCGKDVSYESSYTPGKLYYRGSYHWLRKNGKIVEPLKLVWMCNDCRRKNISK